MQVAQNCLLFRWFKGREVAFALGVNLSIARAGSVLNDVLSPWAATHWGVVGAMWLGVALCAASAACNIASVVIDKSEGRKAGLPEAMNDEEVAFSDVLKLPAIFWLLTALCVILYCAILPFNNIASAFFVETWFRGLPLAQAQQQAGNVMSILFLVSAFGTPPFGGVVDMVGLRAHFLLLSSILLFVTYALIAVIPPMTSMLGLGVVYTIFAGALWPTFALAVPQNQLGSAYGVATALQNAGLAVVPLVVGHLQALAGEGHFENVMHLFAALGAVGVVICLMIFRINSVTRGVLNLPSADAEHILEKGGFQTTEHAPLFETPMKRKQSDPFYS